MKIFKCIVIAILTSKLYWNTWMHLITIINYNTYYALMFTIDYLLQRPKSQKYTYNQKDYFIR